MEEQIKCPHCGGMIALSEAVTKQIRESFEQEYRSQLSKEKMKINEEAIKTVRAEVDVEIRDLKNQLSERDIKLRDAEDKEIEIRRLKRELEEKDKTIEHSVEDRIQAIKSEIEEQAKRKVTEAKELEIKVLQEELNEGKERLRRADELELQLKRQERERGEQERLHQLEIEKTKADESKRIWAIATSKMNEQHLLKDAEKDRQLEDLRKQIETLQQKAEQGSQQAQGEILEIELEKLLLANFRTDKIKPIPKGVSGADVIQQVYTQYGNFCGTILWESKRTKTWSDTWIQKLKDDMREIKANLAVIVSTVMPKEVERIGNLDGIWVVDFQTAIGLGYALRSGLVEIARLSKSLEGKNEKMESLYQYLSGQEFRQRIEAIVESFRGMKEDLESEKRAMNRVWAKREKQIERVMKSTAKMYGDLQGIIGASLQAIETLELQCPSEDQKELFNQPSH